MLAIIAFFVIEIAGMRALGKNYISTIVYWPHDMPVWGKVAHDDDHDAGGDSRKVHEAVRAVHSSRSRT